MYDLIIMILASEERPFIDIENEGIRKTWINNIPDNVKVIFYYGNKKEDSIVGDKLYLDIEDNYNNIGKKTLMAFNYLRENNYEYNYIFRTNISSYVDVNMLLNYLKDKPTERYYDGVVGNHDGILFSSGAGYTISKDIVDIILENQSKWNHNHIDDVALSLLLRESNIHPYGGGTRFDVRDNEQYIDKNYYHYRVKDSTEENSKTRRNDIYRLIKIHNTKGLYN